MQNGGKETVRRAVSFSGCIVIAVAIGATSHLGWRPIVICVMACFVWSSSVIYVMRPWVEDTKK